MSKAKYSYLARLVFIAKWMKERLGPQFKNIFSVWIRGVGAFAAAILFPALRLVELFYLPLKDSEKICEAIDETARINKAERNTPAGAEAAKAGQGVCTPAQAGKTTGPKLTVKK